MDLNALGIIILAFLLLLWNLDFVVTLLNLKAQSPTPPEELAEYFDTERYEKSQAYTRASARFGIVESIVSLFALLAFWFAGGFPWLDGIARSWFSNELMAGVAFLALIFIGHWTIHLPLSIYSTFVLEERFDFNRTTPKTYVVDQIKSLVLSAVLGLPLAAGVLWIFGNVPHAWLWAWGFFTAVQLLLMWLAPAVILPLFNKFEPMPDGELREEIEKMAAKCDFPLGEISIMDGSKRSTKANAYFTGFGKNKKIALYDTLVDEQTTDELVSVLAHEIGHFKCRHILQRLGASILQSGALFFLLGLAIDPNGEFARLLFGTFGVETISPHIGLVLFMILFAPANRILGVLSNAWSRKHEFEADAYAAKVTGQPDSLGTALKKLSAKNLSNVTPHPWRVFLDHSHPPVLQRLEALKQLH